MTTKKDQLRQITTLQPQGVKSRLMIQIDPGGWASQVQAWPSQPIRLIGCDGDLEVHPSARERVCDLKRDQGQDHDS